MVRAVSPNRLLAQLETRRYAPIRFGSGHEGTVYLGAVGVAADRADARH
jgi:hypothetical protein